MEFSENEDDNNITVNFTPEAIHLARTIPEATLYAMNNPPPPLIQSPQIDQIIKSKPEIPEEICSHLKLQLQWQFSKSTPLQ